MSSLWRLLSWFYLKFTITNHEFIITIYYQEVITVTLINIIVIIV